MAIAGVHTQLIMEASGGHASALAEITAAITCPICTEPMYAPFTTACGHLACYACLGLWLARLARCPQCRAAVAGEPVPNLALQTVVDAVVGGGPETTAAREVVRRDRDSGRLFANVFRNAAVCTVDRSDGVARCGNCHWEAHGSRCLNCGVRFLQPPDDEEYDSSVGDSGEDVGAWGEAVSVDEEEEEDDGFIDNRPDDELTEQSDDMGGDENGADDWNGFGLGLEALIQQVREMYHALQQADLDVEELGEYERFVAEREGEHNDSDSDNEWLRQQMAPRRRVVVESDEE